MRYFTKATSIFTVMFALVLGAGTTTIFYAATAQAQAAPVVIALLDRQSIMAISTAGKGLQAAASQRGKQLQDDFQKRQDNLIKQSQLLEQQKATMTPQDYQTKLTELGKQRDQLRLDAQNKRRAFDAATQQALEQIQNQTFAIVKQITAQQNISVVLYKDMVAWGPGAIDITPDVIAQLNQKLPSVKF